MSSSKRMMAIVPVFIARVADDVVFPINILRFKARQIGLRCAQVPRQFVERLAFGILFAGDDGLMFCQRDGALFLELELPATAFLGQHRPRQPGHVQGEVVDAPQIDVGRNLFRFPARAGNVPAAFPEAADAGCCQTPCP